MSDEAPEASDARDEENAERVSDEVAEASEVPDEEKAYYEQDFDTVPQKTSRDFDDNAVGEFHFIQGSRNAQFVLQV